MDWLFTPEGLIALVTLTALELVLGIDNVIFLSILADKLPPEQRDKARRIGLVLAAIMRLALLGSITWIASLTNPLFNTPALAFAGLAVPAHGVTGRDLVLLTGGLFLLFKATHEIHDKLEGEPGHTSSRVPATLAAVLFQIVLLDIVFSLDSVITAVGMTTIRGAMVAAVVLSVACMMIAAKPISDFVSARPTVKILALSFLLLIGTALVAEAFHVVIPKGYIYFAMAFSMGVEMLNLKMRGKGEKVVLHQAYVEAGTST